MSWLLLEGEAVAQQAGVGGNQWLMLIFYIVVIGGVFYFMMYRPQKKKQKAEEKLKNSLQIGDEIITIGGFYGKIISLKEDTMVIESVSDHSKITVARWAMQSNLTIHDDAPSK